MADDSRPRAEDQDTHGAGGKRHCRWREQRRRKRSGLVSIESMVIDDQLTMTLRARKGEVSSNIVELWTWPLAMKF